MNDMIPKLSNKKLVKFGEKILMVYNQEKHPEGEFDIISKTKYK